MSISKIEEINKAFDKFCEENEIYTIGQDDENMVKNFWNKQILSLIEELEGLGDWEEDKDYGLVISHKDWKKFKKSLTK